MPVEVAFDSNGMARIDFYRMRGELSENQVFTEEHLRSIPYDQLFLCAIGNAGSARCSLELVRGEKRARRGRFLGMSPDQIALVERYLIGEGMLHDIQVARTLAEAPRWHDLTRLQQIWFKLTCLEHHVDEPFNRMVEVRELALGATLPDLIERTLREKVIRLIINPAPLKELSPIFSLLAEQVLQAMPLHDRDVVAKGLLRDYCCTSDCFQPTSHRIGTV